MITTPTRDLSDTTLWRASLLRSRARRPRSPQLPYPVGTRDLAQPEEWQHSIHRSQVRRQGDALDPMRRRVRSLSVAAVLSTAAPAALAPGASARASSHAGLLRRGDRGPAVARLQRALGVPADGVFGSQTLHALRQFQTRHRLTVDGIAGPQTLAALGVAGPSRGRGAQFASFQLPPSAHHHGSGRPPRRSGAGGGVSALQRALGLSPDGVFGPQTAGAVRRFQARHHLHVDGVVGAQTRSALGLAPGPTLHPRSSAGGHGRTGHRASSGGGRPRAVDAAIAAGDRIATLPYRFGGGHGSFRDRGYDCSGSVSYVLHAAGVLASPEDSSQLESYGAPGRGRWITVYANAGHAYVTIAGRRFDTSALSASGSRWTDVSRSPGGYVVRHPRGL